MEFSDLHDVRKTWARKLPIVYTRAGSGSMKAPLGAEAAVDCWLAKLERCAVRLDSGRGRRLTDVKELLAQRDAGFHPGGSASELDVLRIIRDAGLPLPVQQLPVSVEGRTYYPDFAWPDRRIFAEYYGLAVHSGASSVSRDNDRLSALVAAGWRPLVFDETTAERTIVERVTQVLLQTTPSDGDVEQRLSA